MPEVKWRCWTIQFLIRKVPIATISVTPIVNSCHVFLVPGAPVSRGRVDQPGVDNVRRVEVRAADQYR